MTPERRLSLVYAAILLAAAAINYVPGLTDADGRAFGIFALDPFDDALHLASALWALAAALVSSRAARLFLVLFGAAYLGDGLCGLLTGWGYLDFGIFTNPSLGASLAPLRIAANLPHLGLGSVALVAGLVRAGRS
ncbi:DUF4383 domain-containing protein [Roseivivax isoporae]|uniref:DUF4383 domain-containing protein n=1 Tax=Roseivivax isoporae LMG 25204 TaxID=1449351 RepID=X7F731_9RHOB|nr:DUF4383 domain-containing protein [Roseivivax isoporae]ETX28590.1 hypothetical protein RISW2_05720 [Roseivivax isoporae LMG 25204]